MYSWFFVLADGALQNQADIYNIYDALITNALSIVNKAETACTAIVFLASESPETARISMAPRGRRVTGYCLFYGI
eukprot:SAG11_NODE_17944_length_504_cov_2.725926_1_plen_76_part_00